jgi:PKD repeat protein
MRIRRALAAFLVLIGCTPAVAQLTRAELASHVAAATRETFDVGQQEAERLFAGADAAIWFPQSRRGRWLTYSRSIADTEAALFAEQLERDYPLFRFNAHGPYLLKMPLTSDRLAEVSTATPVSQATIFTESFENGMGNWDLDDNTLGLYSWGATTCEAWTGSHSADALRGGANTLTCTSTYDPNVSTEMRHKGCEGIQGASTAWLDAWIHIDTESGGDALAFYYADPAGKRHGYAFSGTWTAWFHVVMNLKQWYGVGDVTATACPSLSLDFDSNASVQSGLGARMDDITISNTASSFLAAAISASSATGSAPLTVAFAPVVTGSTGSPAYNWTFGDAASSSSTSHNPSFTYSTAGDYTVRLRVEEAGVRAYAHTVIHAGSAASCSISCSANVPSSANAGSAVAFQASATLSNCSGSTSYAWQFGDGQSSTQQNPSHAYAAAGTYSWSLTTAAGGATCSKSGRITVAATSSSGKKSRAVRPGPSSGNLDSKTIGALGGTLSGGGFTLTVPSGAFTSNAAMTLVKTGPPDGSNGGVSDRFRLSGLPETLAKDLNIEIQLSPSAPALAPGEKYFITMDAPAWVDRIKSTAPFRVPASVNGAKLTVTLPKNWPDLPTTTASSEKSAQALGLTAEVLANALKTIETAHFTSTVASNKWLEGTALLNLFESHYDKLEDLGFSFGCRIASGAFRKIEVVPIAFGQGGDLGGHISRSSPCGGGWIFNDYLQITTSYPASDASVNYAAGHELFHLVQDMYSPGGARANLWLKEASSIWYETVLGNPCPTVQSAYPMFPWNGLFNSMKSAAPGSNQADIEAHHGYGAAYFLGYHSRSLTDPFVSLIWQFIKQGQTEVAAMQSAMGSADLAEFWATFAKEYYTTGMSQGCPVSWAMFAKDTIQNESSLPKSVRLPASPLSARSWNLDLRNFSSSTFQPAQLTATGLISRQSVYAFKLSGKTLTSIGELTSDAPTQKIDDLNTMKGTILVVVLVDRNLPSGSINAQNTTNEVTVSLGPNAPAAINEVCFDGSVTVQTVQTRIPSVKHITRCVKEGELGAHISVSSISGQAVSVMAQEQYTDGVWFKVVANNLPMKDPAVNRYGASGTKLQQMGVVIEYEPEPDCSGGYCEKVKLQSVDWPTASVWANGK